MNSAAEIAATILVECTRRSIEVSNLKLQKLLYYSEAWSLALNNESLFGDPIEAWVHGPVVPSVFRAYKEYRWNPIPTPKGDVVRDEAVVDHLNDLLDAYGSLHATQLERLSHIEKPWLEARGTLAPDEPSSELINRATMKAFYSEKLG